MVSSENKNEHITLWILEQDRQKNREKVQKQKTLNQPNTCHKCKKNYSEAKLVQYFACPHCSSRIEEETKTTCQHWFGFLSGKDSSESLPQECVECSKVMDCMLKHYYDSNAAVSEIKKWY